MSSACFQEFESLINSKYKKRPVWHSRARTQGVCKTSDTLENVNFLCYHLRLVDTSMFDAKREGKKSHFYLFSHIMPPLSTPISQGEDVA